MNILPINNVVKNAIFILAPMILKNNFSTNVYYYNLVSWVHSKFIVERDTQKNITVTSKFLKLKQHSQTFWF